MYTCIHVRTYECRYFKDVLPVVYEEKMSAYVARALLSA